ncbi:mu-like prophage major head subunit gpT [Mycolicibacterium brisbanense]|uniref:Mu-like prophage major head subunit gpT n=1 Tax=Mycolicibacterium brisbanense TaxID=146020 RepID=A0A100VVM0_9MYCO|nr:mu-like prophage major head subunit gpT [Mycolicibacterium brisbanense]
MPLDGTSDVSGSIICQIYNSKEIYRLRDRANHAPSTALANYQCVAMTRAEARPIEEELWLTATPRLRSWRVPVIYGAAVTGSPICQRPQELLPC